MDVPTDHLRNTLETLVAPFRAYALYAAVKLGVPDRVRDGYRLPDPLAEATGSHPPSLRRLLRALAFQDVLDTDDFEEYRLTAAGELLCRDHPSHLHELVLLYGEQAYPSFAHVVHCLRTGEPGFPLVFGATFLEYYKKNADAGRVFDRAMAAGTAFFKAVPAAVDLPEGATVVDVGGGDGSLLETLLTASPTIRGVLAEERVDAGLARFASSPVGGRCEVVQTDFFTSVPAGHDVYLLSRILHDWDDDDCVRILTACRKAMNPGGTLLVVERVIGLPDARSLAIDWDLHMLVNTGGLERTLKEYQALLRQTGFEYASSASLPQDVMVLRSVAV
ncbi:methyltransferase [Saccharothrix sp. BKS2]|uniref:methyltransferase n=1 Tax=Saccharothrix sp. BKS2 TaxID=3064400 RepID=UPI0039E9F8FD